MTSRALFLDRDGTLVYPRHYPSRPEDLLLYPGMEAGLRRMQAEHWRIVVITNQSGLARGLFSEDDLSRMHEYLADELERSGVFVDGFYYCPHHPEGTIAKWAISCDCRKPAPGMLLRAAADLDIDLSRSWFVGDILDDVEAGNRAGCRTILVDIGSEALPNRPIRRPDFVARNTQHALDLIAAAEQLGPTVDVGYAPERWGVRAWSGRSVANEMAEGAAR